MSQSVSLLSPVFFLITPHYRHRKKKAITSSKSSPKESRLMRHTFPHINSPRPRLHNTPRNPHKPNPTKPPPSSRPHISSPRPTTSHHHFLETYPNHFPESPIASLHSFGSDFSISSGGGGGGVKRGERRRKERHYNKVSSIETEATEYKTFIRVLR